MAAQQQRYRARVVLALALPAVLFGVWWVLSADSTTYYAPPLAKILAAFQKTWTLDQLRAEGDLRLDMSPSRPSDTPQA